MTAEQFTYWLQGFFEITESEELTKEQTKVVRDHLSAVFEKVTPDRSNRKTTFCADLGLAGPLSHGSEKEVC